MANLLAGFKSVSNLCCLCGINIIPCIVTLQKNFPQRRIMFEVYYKTNYFKIG